ncbi:MerR family transcriptional regulator [Novosphingobium album (ex Hu et al. 2023)]|uniref:MerR family DNA-binding transcriptional regulator n=1 Tax=Novosphingobium album (ex Hu et al. 2023) TaxID=2930093 RepID=A0ABT0B216_9SPHN|nr:MerR family DNA-binding transcriptional regulator [Novosphingobium album (ex Hu et al. 2023)]MCJ2179060.1 MerR family DNA-binding transcriptional regulator [Novosphingobium album (ex Hu et al. 2023)]
MSPASAATAAENLEMLGIQEAANLLGVTMRTLRFYEDKGLIAPQRAGTTRIYSRREIGRMQLILRGKRLGFSIREIKEFLDLYDVDPEHNEQVRQLIAKVGERIGDLRKQQKAIEQTLGELLSIEQQAREWLQGQNSGADTVIGKSGV